MYEIEASWKYEAGDLVRDVAISADSKYIVMGAADRKVYLFNRYGNLLWKFETRSTVESVAISASGDVVVVGSRDRNIYCFSRTGEEMWKHKTGERVWKVTVSRNGEYILAVSMDRTVYLLDRYGKLLWKHRTGEEVGDIALSPSAEGILIGSYDKNVYYFNSFGKMLWRFRTGRWIECLSVSPDGRYIAVGSNDRNVYLLANTGELVWKFSTKNHIWSISTSPNGEYTVIGVDGGINFFDKEGRLIASHSTEIYDVKDVIFSANGKFVAAGSRHDRAYFFDRKGRLLWEHKLDKWAESVAISHNGDAIVVGSIDRNVYFFDNAALYDMLVARARHALEVSRAFGVDTTEIEKILQRASALAESHGYTEAFDLAIEAENLAREVKEVSRPELAIKVVARDKLRYDQWNNLSMLISNTGGALATRVFIRVKGRAKIRGIRKYFEIPAGRELTLPIGLKPMDIGMVPLNIHLVYQDYEGKEYISDSVCYVQVTGEFPPEVKARKPRGLKKPLPTYRADEEITPFFIQRVSNGWLVCPFCTARSRYDNKGFKTENKRCANCGEHVE